MNFNKLHDVIFYYFVCKSLSKSIGFDLIWREKNHLGETGDDETYSSRGWSPPPDYCSHLTFHSYCTRAPNLRKECGQLSSAPERRREIEAARTTAGEIPAQFVYSGCVYIFTLRDGLWWGCTATPCLISAARRFCLGLHEKQTTESADILISKRPKTLK